MSKLMIELGKVMQTYNYEHFETRAKNLSSKFSPSLKILAISAVCIDLSACSMSSGASAITSENTVVSQSVSEQAKPEGIASADAELIKSVVADANDGSSPSVLAWSNPETGNKGTITAIDKFTGSHGQKCKKFQTTVDTFMGISLYNGETCELRRGMWVLSWFLREGA